MIIITLLLCFTLNIINHGNALVGILNSLLLFFTLNFYFKFSHQELSFTKIPHSGTLLVVMIGATPLFTRANDILIIFFTIGFTVLILFYLTTKFKKMLISIIIIYLLFASLYANGLIKPPFSFQTNLLIFNDNWINLYITQMKAESNYMPYIIRTVIFNPSINFYVMLSRLTGLFTLKNFYDSLLIANIYPLVIGLILDLRNWNKSKMLLILCIFLISLSMVVSRSIEINNTFVLLSPLLIYFILRGLNTVSKKTYLTLFIISIFIATSP